MAVVIERRARQAVNSNEANRAKHVVHGIARGTEAAAIGISSIFTPAVSISRATVHEELDNRPAITSTLEAVGLSRNAQEIAIPDSIPTGHDPEQPTSDCQTDQTEVVGVDADASAILLSDNFDDPDNGILPASSPNPSQFTREYSNGEYVIGRPTGGSARAELPGVYSDTSIVADARFVGDPTGQVINIGTRKQPDGSDYRISFWVNNGGGLILQRFDSGKEVRLATARLPAGLFQLDAMNNIELSTVGNNIYAKVNDHVVAVAEDNTYQSGVSWIGSWGNGVASAVAFDNLVVTELDPSAPVPTVETPISEASTPEAIPTPTPTPTPTPEAAPIPLSSMEFRFGPDVPQGDKALIQKWVSLTKEYWGKDAPFMRVYAFSDVDTLLDTYQKECVCPPDLHLRNQFERGIKRNMFMMPQPGALLIFIAPNTEWARFNDGDKIQRIAHEEFHAFQYTLSGERGIPGPIWFIEGSATYSHLRLAEISGLASWDRLRRNQADKARSIPEPLSAFEAWKPGVPGGGPEQPEPYIIGFVATDFLASKYGDQSILAFFRAAGEAKRAGQSWQTAFEKTFMPIEEFYSQFDTYRAQLKGN